MACRSGLPCVAALITDANGIAPYSDTAASLADVGAQVERMAFAAGEKEKNLQNRMAKLIFFRRGS